MTVFRPEVKQKRDFQAGGSVTENLSFALLPVFKLLGTNYKEVMFFSSFKDGVDIFTKGILRYDSAIASFKLGLGVKTEGNLVISGTKGYAFILMRARVSVMNYRNLYPA